VTALTAATFDRSLAEPVPLLVDFWSEYCSPCLAVGQSVTELATEMAGRLRVAKIDILAEPQLAARYAISSVPTILLFRQGEPVVRITGARPKSHIARAIAPHLE
jgi:thioredoxin 1